jgi:hypothetical protein
MPQVWTADDGLIKSPSPGPNERLPSNPASLQQNVEAMRPRPQTTPPVRSFAIVAYLGFMPVDET